MGGTGEGARKMRQKMIDKYGGEEAYREEMRVRASKGGRRTAQTRAPEDYPFARDKELAKRAGQLKKGEVF